MMASSHTLLVLNAMSALGFALIRKHNRRCMTKRYSIWHMTGDIGISPLIITFRYSNLGRNPHRRNKNLPLKLFLDWTKGSGRIPILD